jgi:hypothetical protein
MSGSHKRLFKVFSKKLSGMIHLTLSLADFGMIFKYRDAAAKVLMEMVTILPKHTKLSAEALAYRKLVLDTFLDSTDDHPMRLALCFWHPETGWSIQSINGSSWARKFF